MTIGSLFSGIGGLELGLEWAGFGPVVWQVEQSEFCRGVLARHWPGADRSVTDVRAARSLSAVDLICGGFPCQDVSSAGAGAGLDGRRSGLWYEFRRVVGELRPGAVVVENVASGKSRWLCEVRSDLHALGYRTRALLLHAADVGAPHRRARIFVLALANGSSVGPEARGLGGGGEDEAGRRLFALAGSGPGALATPMATSATIDRGGRPQRGKNAQGGPSLAEVVHHWPTPTASAYGSGQNGCPGDGRLEFKGKGAPSLHTLAKQTWPTATATDARASGAALLTTESGRHAGTTLSDAAVRQGSASMGGRLLNPAWVESLMGFPQDWTRGPQLALFTDGPPGAESPSTTGSPRAPCPPTTSPPPGSRHSATR